jgi:aminoglycoside 6'-N-acetyltransferase I
MWRSSTTFTEVLAFAVTTTSFRLENGQIAELEDLYVIPTARRRGLVELLLDDSARWARERGCRQLELVIAPNGLDVAHLHWYYLGRGFTDEGRRLLSRPLRP